MARLEYLSTHLGTEELTVTLSLKIQAPNTSLTGIRMGHPLIRMALSHVMEPPMDP